MPCSLLAFGRRSRFGGSTLCFEAGCLQLGCGCSSLSCGLLPGQFLLCSRLARRLLTLFLQTLRFLLCRSEPGSFLPGGFQPRSLLLNCCNARGFLACSFHAQSFLARSFLPYHFLPHHFNPLGFQAGGFLLGRSLSCVLQPGRFLLCGGGLCLLTQCFLSEAFLSRLLQTLDLLLGGFQACCGLPGSFFLPRRFLELCLQLCRSLFESFLARCLLFGLLLRIDRFLQGALNALRLHACGFQLGGLVIFFALQLILAARVLLGQFLLSCGFLAFGSGLLSF